ILLNDPFDDLAILLYSIHLVIDILARHDRPIPSAAVAAAVLGVTISRTRRQGRSHAAVACLIVRASSATRQPSWTCMPRARSLGRGPAGQRHRARLALRCRRLADRPQPPIIAPG